jgi:hypothetical protein
VRAWQRDGAMTLEILDAGGWTTTEKSGIGRRNM